MNAKEMFEKLNQMPVDEARKLVAEYVVKFWQLPAGSYFNLLNDINYMTYRKIADEIGPGGIVNKNAVNVTTGQVCWIADSVTCVKNDEFTVRDEFTAAKASFQQEVRVFIV